MAESLNDIVWSGGMLFLIICTGVYFTVKIRFFQLIKFKTVLKNTICVIFKDKRAIKSSDRNSISQFQALSTALAATMGTGNIVGAATAVCIGGAGAVFWMWVSAVLGMAVIYAENFLGTLFRYKNKDGEWIGGPQAYLEKGTGSKKLAVAYALMCGISALGMGNMAQSNSISAASSAAFGIEPVLSGIVVAFLVGVIIIGGVKRIGRITQMLIPVISLLYILAAIVVIIKNAERVPLAFEQIFEGAFGYSAVGGGISGAAVKQAVNIGLRRGIFSNEAGLGSSALLHSESDLKSPQVQGMWGMFEVFVDTIVCCTLTVLVILTTGSDKSGLNGADLVIKAFESGFGRYSALFVTASIVLFAFATLVGWAYCGEKSIRYVFGAKGGRAYKVIFIVAIVVGAAVGLEEAWAISDIFNGLMIIPNLMGLILLSDKVKRPLCGKGGYE